MNKLGQLIKKYRELKNYDVSTLSKLTGIDAGQLYKYERGERKPKFELLLNIANALEIPVECLLSEFYTPVNSQITEEQIEAYQKREGFLNELFFALWSERENLSDDEKNNLYSLVDTIINQYKSDKVSTIIKMISTNFLSDDDLIKISDYARNELGITDTPKSFDDI